MHDEIIDPREVYEPDYDYDLSDEETLGQDWAEAHPQPGDLCDWCGAPLDHNGQCSEKCRSWAKDNEQPTRCVCGSDALEVRDYDHGIDRETGYHDTGQVVVCLECGRSDEL